MKYLILICSLLISAVSYSQGSGSIQGRITDKEMNNEPLMYASITIKGNSTIVQSNLHGNFEITDIAPGNYTLAVGYLGYDSLELPVEVKINEVTDIEAGLVAKTVNLDLASLTGDMEDRSEYPNYMLEKGRKE
ncbi:MAG TPA: carboxypeptidase-like regulatory domain-containing protein [Eudoraea sp.]|nr:carboxypeptidase-like regulatory domain-containing protein [Eudoraea sp.]